MYLFDTDTLSNIVKSRPSEYLLKRIALQHNLTLITGNIRHFERIPGLKLENWIK